MHLLVFSARLVPQSGFANIAAVITKLKVAGSAKGVSGQSIKATILAQKGNKATSAQLNNAIKKAVAAGKLIQIKGSFKVAKAAVKKVTATKKAAPKKKTATKKKPAAKKPAAKKVG